MAKKYLEENVYEATLKRIKYIFDEFDNIYCSFSGGKDSTVCVHLFCEEARKRNRKIGLFHIDIECAYKYTMEHVEYIYKEYQDVIIPIWVCLPMSTDNGLSYGQQMWKWWDTDLKEIWTRDMPTMDYIINLENNPLSSFYKKDMTFEEFTPKFGLNYANIFGESNKKTACIIGIRTQESLNRWRAICCDKNMYKNKEFSTTIKENKLYNFYPIYDWNVEDIWVYFAKSKKKYNKIYDLMYQAGVPINKMRIDEPFGNESKVGLNLFRIIEPKTWSKVVGRVSGTNITNIYDKKSLSKNKYKLPKGYTWESYTKFLLNTLPEEAKKHYEEKFNIFIKWWKEKGSGLTEKEINILEKKYKDKIINTNKLSTRGNKNKLVIKFTEIVDTIPELDSKVDILTWKRLAMVILKNDYWCKTLSFGLNKYQQEKRKRAIEKYKDL